MIPTDSEYMKEKQEARREERNGLLDRLDKENEGLPRIAQDPDYRKTQYQIDTERAIAEGALEGLERGGGTKTRGGRVIEPNLDR